MKTFEIDGKMFAVINSAKQYHKNIGKSCGLTYKESVQWFNKDMIFCDPDYLRINGQKIPFTEHKTANCQFICLRSKSIKKAQIITSFFAYDDLQRWVQVDNTWKKFDSLKIGIAYRGGKGYAYSIWEYKAN